MAKENLVKKLGRNIRKKALPYVFSGLLALGGLAGLSAHYGCPGNFTDPNSEQPEKPVVTQPIARLTAEPTEGDVPLEVYLNGSKSTCDPNCYLKEYHWDFDGDGVIDSKTLGAYTAFTYKKFGIYQASLEVIDSNNQISDKDLETIVVNEKPVAILTANPTEGDAPLFVELDGSLSYVRAPNCYLKEYHWDFDGDGNTDTISQQSQINRTYEEGGEYNTTLEVVDNEGRRSDKALKTIVVNENILGKIAFWSNRDQGTGELYIGDLQLDNEGNYIGLNNIQRLTDNINNDISPAWSPDGRHLVWSANRPTPDGWFALYVVNPNETDGDDERRITPFINDFSAYKPTWCIDGKIYFNFRDGNSNKQGIARIDPNGNGDIEKIIEEPYHYWLSGRPACSPDGSKIAFVTDRDGNTEIYIANIDGTGEGNLTNHPADDGLPVWYGDELFFISNRDGTPDIWAINSSGEGLRKILENSGIETDPGVSSDGSKIIFTHDIDMSNPQIYFINADSTGGWTQLTFGGVEGANCYPAWKPKIEDLNFN